MDCSGVVAEGGCSDCDGVHGDGCCEFGAVADEYGVWAAVAVEADSQAGYGVIAVGAGVGFADEGFDDDCSGEDWSVGEGGGNHGVVGDCRVFSTDFLRGVVGVQCPAVLSGEALGGVLPHDLGSGDRLSFGEGVAVSDVEDEAGWLAHWLDADEVVGDELGVALANEGEGEAGEVRDVGGGGLVFKDHRSLLGVPVVVLVFEDTGHEAEFAGGDFAAFAEHWAPFPDEGVFLALVDYGCFVEVGFLGDGAAVLGCSFGEVSSLLASGDLAAGGGESGG